MIPGIASWLPYLSSCVGHAPFASIDDYGVPTSTGATTWYPAHIEDAMAASGGTGGGANVITARLHIILGAIVPIDPRDRLIVKSPFTTRNSTGAFSTQENAQIVRVSPSMSPIFGQHHTEVWTE